MKPNCVFVLLAALLLIPRSEAKFGGRRFRELIKIMRDTDLAKMPGGAAAIAAAIRQVRIADGCQPYLCFAIDGSRQLGKDFELQQQFLAIVSVIVSADERTDFSGVQYGRRNKAIRRLRGDIDGFLLDVERMRWQRSRVSFISGGIAWCANQLAFRRGGAKKIVLFGDSRTSYRNLGGLLSPAALIATFRHQSPDNEVCAVAVGFSPMYRFTNIIGRDPISILKVTEWSRSLEILPALVRDICSVGKPTNTFRR